MKRLEKPVPRQRRKSRTCPRSSREGHVLFEHFDLLMVETGEATIQARRGGDGPPILLLHGFPQTHMMWHKVAPRLARHFTVVAADLRGYGGSSKPRTTADHAPYSKRGTARDMIVLMQHLGFHRFSVAGHDRGGRCAYRLALDSPDRVHRLAVLDIIPTSEVFRRADMAFALSFWPWSLLAQPHPLPECLIGANPQMVVDYALDTWSGNPGAFPDEVRGEYVRAFSNPETIHAICEEYRAAATLDYQHDEADRDRNRIPCPLLALWSRRGPLETWYDTLAIWKDWAEDARGRSIDCGHFLAEEAAEETYTEFRAFLGR